MKRSGFWFVMFMVLWAAALFMFLGDWIPEASAEATYKAPAQQIDMGDRDGVSLAATYQPPNKAVVAPYHACDDAGDCADAVDDVCDAVGAGGQQPGSTVALSWNAAAGRGKCEGDCANGGKVVVTCSRGQ